MADRLRLDVDGGKYTVVQPEKGGAFVLRHGEEWLPLTHVPGSNCWLALAYEQEAARDRINRLEQALLKAKNQFLYYAIQHETKTLPGGKFAEPGPEREDTLAKAKANRDLAAEIDAVLDADR